MGSFESYFPSASASYKWFFYLGIFLFVTHIGLYGIGIDLSYFGLLLIYLGWAKPNITNWFRIFLWVFLILDIFSTFRGYYTKWMKKEEPKKKKNPTFRPKAEKEREEEDA